jgi:hypothetical protein
MGNFAYVSSLENRFARSTTSLVVSNAEVNFPAVNAISVPVSKVHRFTNHNSETYTFNLGAPETPASTGWALAIVNHNLSATAVVSIDAGTTTGYGGFTTKTMLYRARAMYIDLTLASVFQYWKITIADTNNLYGYIQTGYLLLAPKTTLTFMFDFGWEFADEENVAYAETRFGTPHVTKLFERMSGQFEFTDLTTAQYATLRAFYRDHHGRLNPFLLIPDASEVDCFFGRLTNDRFAWEIGMRRNIPLMFQEDGHGKTLTVT